jgi:hypothetical protein
MGGSVADNMASAIGGGVVLLTDIAIAGAVMKGVSNMADGLNKTTGSFEGVKPAKIPKVAPPEVRPVPKAKDHTVKVPKVNTYGAEKIKPAKEDYFSPAAIARRNKLGQI